MGAYPILFILERFFAITTQSREETRSGAAGCSGQPPGLVRTRGAHTHLSHLLVPLPLPSPPGDAAPAQPPAPRAHGRGTGAGLWHPRAAFAVSAQTGCSAERPSSRGREAGGTTALLVPVTGAGDPPAVLGTVPWRLSWALQKFAANGGMALYFFFFSFSVEH